MSIVGNSGPDSHAANYNPPVMPAFPYERLVVIGTTASGKSTLARRLAERFGLDFIELDALHWERNWQAAPEQVFRARTEEATRARRWVVAGNYEAVRGIVWPRAQAVVWLDYSFGRVLWQLTVRTLRRSLRREELWNGNRERLWWHLKFWSDESLYRWLLKTYWRRRREYPRLLAESENARLRIIRLQSPRAAEAWLQSLSG